MTSRNTARHFADLHRTPDPVVLPNAWDAGSAVLIAAAGAPAIATSSAAVAWSLGKPDGEHLTRDEVAAVVARMTAVVEVPVSADIEAGYGVTPDEVAATVRAVVEAGVVRISLGTALAEAAYGQAVAATRELFGSGAMKALQGFAGFGEVNGSFR